MRTIEQWEEDLASRLSSPQVQLIGEINLDKVWVSQLGDVVGRRYVHLGPTRGLEVLLDYTPFVFLTLLVGNGIYNYQDRKVWPGLGVAIGKELSAPEQSAWGIAFQDCLERFGKPSFPNTGGRRYVTRILLHGGIPNSSLEDFFEYYLRPTILCDGLPEADERDALEIALSRATTAFADAPIERFFRYGGRIALDFFKRSHRLARAYFERGHLLAADEVGLPARVVDKFRVWSESHTIRHARRERSGLRLRRPRLIINPGDFGLGIRFPAQTLPGLLDPNRVELRLTEDETSVQTTLLWPYHHGRDLIIEEPRPMSLIQPATSYQVTFLIDGEDRRTWTLPGLTDDASVLVFDSETFDVIVDEPYLSEQMYWIVYPADCQLNVATAGSFPSPPGWERYRFDEVDLTGQTSLEVTGSSTGWKLPVVPRHADLRPELVVHPDSVVYTQSDGTSLVAGLAPGVRLPTTPAHLADPKIWRLSLKSIGRSWPPIDRSCSLHDRELVVRHDEGALVVELSQTTLLGVSACGTYEVEVKGPLGHDARWRFQLWPELDLGDVGRIYVPEPNNGPQPVNLKVVAGAQDVLNCPETPGSVRRLPSGAGWSVSLAPAVSSRRLEITRTIGDKLASVEFSLGINRLHWSIVDEAAASPQYLIANHTIRLSVDELEQLLRPVLAVWLSQERSIDPRTSLMLEATGGDGIPVADPIAVVARVHSRWRFPLVGMMDAFRSSQEPTIRLSIKSDTLEKAGLIRGLPVAFVSRQWKPDGVGIGTVDAPSRSPKAKDLELRWNEAPVPLRHRQVRLWNVWQPWQAPMEIPIPDGARGRLPIPVGTPNTPLRGNPGRIALEFLVRDPWLTVTDKPKFDPQAHWPIVTLTQPAQRLSTLVQRATQQPEARFRSLLEQFYIFVDLNDKEAAERPANGCLATLECADLDEQIVFFKGLHRIGLHAHIETTQSHLFAPATALPILERAQREEISADLVREYVHLRPGEMSWPPDVWLAVHQLGLPDLTELAVKETIERRNRAAIDVCLEELRSERMSEREAARLLGVQSEYVLQELEPEAGDPIVLHLMSAVGHGRDPRAFVVEPGNWIRTSAGWGIIEEICDWDGTPLPHMSFLDRERRLTIRLRPDSDDETVVYDSLEEHVRFRADGYVYLCTKCKACAARSQKDILERHERAAHWNEVDSLGGIQRYEDGILPLGLKVLQFRTRRPADEWEYHFR